jgi:alkaline phosphatase D
MTLNRRELLKRSGWLCTLTTAACADDDKGSRPEPDAIVPDDLPQYEFTGTPGSDSLFQHGVASGDPLTDAVVIWTRVTSGDSAPVTVWYEVARDPDFVSRLSVGEFVTDDAMDFTVKLDVVDLDPGRAYYYRFATAGQWSSVGRLRTAPEGEVDRLRFGVVSCSNYQSGYFHSYRVLARDPSLQAIIHLGDYIYEYPAGTYGSERRHEPENEIITLSDYRQRYAQYRRDPDLAEVHRQHPFIVAWDDHESANNSWSGGAQNHNEGEGEWSDRIAAARQAYLEWMPIREFEGGRIYRAFTFGNLVDLIMLDTRIEGRDEEAATTDRETHLDPDRSLLGDAQHAWLATNLREASAQWKLLGQQVMFSQLKLVNVPIAEGPGQILNADGWDGYEASRNLVLDQLRDEAINDVVVLTGDIHTSWVFDITKDAANPDAYNPETGDGSLGVEFVCTATTSPGLDISALGDRVDAVIKPPNPNLKYVNVEKRGYLVLDITAERTHGTIWLFEDIDKPEDIAPFIGATYETTAGSNRARIAGAVDAPDSSPAAAPPATSIES